MSYSSIKWTCGQKTIWRTLSIFVLFRRTPFIIFVDRYCYFYSPFGYPVVCFKISKWLLLFRIAVIRSCNRLAGVPSIPPRWLIILIIAILSASFHKPRATASSPRAHPWILRSWPSVFTDRPCHDIIYRVLHYRDKYIIFTYNIAIIVINMQQVLLL